MNISFRPLAENPRVILPDAVGDAQLPYGDSKFCGQAGE